MEQTLLLNATYEPLKIVHWQRAVTLWCQGKVEILSVHDREVRAVSYLIRVPRRPEKAPAIALRISLGLRQTPESWRDYLYWNVELDAT
jgi:hypothetical protein